MADKYPNLRAPTWTEPPGDNAYTRKQYLLAEISVSYGLCEDYKRRLLLASRANNAAFDIATTALSALATAFTPLATVHALSAAAAITSGTKTAIDADIYENATAPIMVQAIQSTYDDPMDKLHTKVLTAKDDKALGTLADDASVQAIHQKCSLTEALVELQTLQAAAAKAKTDSAPSPPADTPKLPFKVNDRFKLSDGSIVTVETAVSTTAAANFTVKYLLAKDQTENAATTMKTSNLSDFMAMLGKNQATVVKDGS